MKPEDRKQQYHPYVGTAKVGDKVSFRYGGKNRFGSIVDLGGSVTADSAWIKMKTIDGQFRTFTVSKIELT
jgi:hypothetical protein